MPGMKRYLPEKSPEASRALQYIFCLLQVSRNCWRSMFRKRCFKSYIVVGALLLIGCSSAVGDRGAANIRAVDHTTGAINWMSVNGYRVDGGGGRTCCIGLPLRWRPGVTADIEWEFDPEPFAKIKELTSGYGYDEDAWAAYAAKFQRHRKLVEIPEWPDKQSCQFNIHFLTCGQVKVTTVCLAVHHPDYPIKDGFGLKEPKVCPK